MFLNSVKYLFLSYLFIAIQLKDPGAHKTSSHILGTEPINANLCHWPKLPRMEP